tara:strand:+ start:37 stop:333 length:297 start_codon:yes stop_codon:yes gene_type:complete
MKIKEKDYKKLSQYLEQAISHCGVGYLEDHKLNLKDDKRVKDINRRFAFDLLFIAGRVNKECRYFVSDVLYEYINDDHIYTALKHFVKNYPALTNARS